MDINIKLNVGLPEPEKYGKSQNLLDKVKDYIQCCEMTDVDSEYHWSYLKNLYDKLNEKNNRKGEALAIKKLLHEFFSKYNNLGSDDKYVNMDGVDFFKFTPPTGR